MICFNLPPYTWIIVGDSNGVDDTINNAIDKKIKLGLDSPTQFKVFNDQGKYVGGSV